MMHRYLVAATALLLCVVLTLSVYKQSNPIPKASPEEPILSTNGPRTTPEARQPYPLRVELLTPHHKYKVGEDVDLTLTITNQSAASVTVNRQDIRQELEGLTVIGPDGNPVQGLNHHGPSYEFARDRSQSLAPGESTTINAYAVNHFIHYNYQRFHFPMDTAGTYRIRWAVAGGGTQEVVIEMENATF